MEVLASKLGVYLVGLDKGKKASLQVEDQEKEGLAHGVERLSLRIFYSLIRAFGLKSL